MCVSVTYDRINGQLGSMPNLAGNSDREKHDYIQRTDLFLYQIFLLFRIVKYFLVKSDLLAGKLQENHFSLRLSL